MNALIDFIFHIDNYLNAIVESYGYLVYFLLFAVVFCETGLVITPFLPGDSIIFACGTLAALGKMNIMILFVVFTAAAVSGDAINYLLGKHYGPAMVKKLGGRFIKEKYIEDTRIFYRKHGGLTVFLARFVPVVRTFAPFVAGMSKMEYREFGFYNIIGGFTWTALFLTIGFYFGNIPLIKQHFSTAVLAIIFVSLLPVFIKYVAGKGKTVGIK